MTSIFEGRPPPKQGLLQSKQGSFGFQVYVHMEIISFVEVEAGGKQKSLEWKKTRDGGINILHNSG